MHAFEFSNDLREICKPLFQKTEISFFECFQLLHESDSIEWLSTNPNRTALWANKKMSVSTIPMFSDVRDKKLRYYFWDSVLYSMDDMAKRKNIENFLALSQSEFCISHGFVIFEDLGKYSNFYSFGTLPDNECMREFYINNLDILQKFIFHLKEKTMKIFKFTAASGVPIEQMSKFRNLDCDFNVRRFYLDVGVNKTSEKKLCDIARVKDSSIDFKRFHDKRSFKFA